MLDAPGVVEGLRQLAAVAGPHRALLLWSDASRALRLHGTALPPADQLRAVEHMRSLTSDPASRAALVGWAARLRLYLVLERDV